MPLHGECQDVVGPQSFGIAECVKTRDRIIEVSTPAYVECRPHQCGERKAATFGHFVVGKFADLVCVTMPRGGRRFRQINSIGSVSSTY